jgi:hypothetical protein
MFCFTQMLLTEDEGPEDVKCLKAMAEIFQSPRAGIMDHIYWGNLSTSSTLVCKDPLADDVRVRAGAACTVM